MVLSVQVSFRLHTVSSVIRSAATLLDIHIICAVTYCITSLLVKYTTTITASTSEVNDINHLDKIKLNL